jgi:hypothetical protein
MKSAIPDADLLAALSLDDKVRLLTGTDNWSTCPLPAIGLRAMVVSDGPAGVRGVTMDEADCCRFAACPECGAPAIQPHRSLAPQITGRLEGYGETSVHHRPPQTLP